MKLTYVTGRMRFELEAETAKQLFEMLAEVQQIFEADARCGRCDCEVLHCRVRQVEQGAYYELVCAMCDSTLQFGQTRTGSLFAKRKDKDGNILDKRGWRVPFGQREPIEYHETAH